MASSWSRRTRLSILFGGLGVIGIQSAVRLWDGGTISVPLIVGAAVGFFVLTGPVAWWCRKHLSKTRRKGLAYVVVGAVWIPLIFVIAVTLTIGVIGLLMHAITVGAILGFCAVCVCERGFVPAALRSPLNRKSEGE